MILAEKKAEEEGGVLLMGCFPITRDNFLAEMKNDDNILV